MLPVAFLVSILSASFLVQPALSQSNGFDPHNIDDSSENFSQFGKELYRICTSSDVFEKVFKFLISEEEAADAFFNSTVYFSEKVGLKNPGSVRLQVALASADAYLRGVTSVEAFKVYSNVVEAFLATLGILNPDNAEQLALDYYTELERVLREVEQTNQPAFEPAAVYISTEATASYVLSLGVYSEETLRTGVAFFGYEWNNAVGTRSSDECSPIFTYIYQKYFNLCYASAN